MTDNSQENQDEKKEVKQIREKGIGVKIGKGVSIFI